MFKLLCYMAICAVPNTAPAQSKLGFENYTFYGRGVNTSQMPIVTYENKMHWYAQARYNYEDEQTMSVYLGRSFSKNGDFSYNVIPMAGAVGGRFNGASLALNTQVGYQDFFASSQSQYSFSYKNRFGNFFYTWAEMGYQPLKWFFAGVSLQQTQLYNEAGLWEPGVLMGFSFKKWSFPVYAFNPASDRRYFILGINLELHHQKPEKTNNNLVSSNK
jgi:hypothetical protein